MSGGDPVSFGVDSFTQWDLEVGVHGVVDVSIRSPLICLGIAFDSRLEPFGFVLKGEDSETVDFFAVLDGLDQTSGNVTEGTGINVGIGGEYVFHGMGQIA